MSTPKEKLVHNQAILTKKKKFFRILQSSKCDQSYYYCCNVNQQLKNEIEKKVQTILIEIKEEEQTNVRLDDKTTINADGDEKKNKTNVRVAKKRQKNVIGSPELVFGLNQSLKMIKNAGACMVLVDCDLAANLLNIVHKLCSINKIYCIDINLKELQQLFKLSSLSILSLKSCVAEKVSKFNKIYEFIVENCFKNGNESTQLNKESPLKTIQSEPNIEQLSLSVNYYVENNSDPYSAIMETKLNKINNCISHNDFTTQASFIALSKSDQSLYFANYSKQQCRYNFEIIMPEDVTREQRSVENANKFAVKLFDLDNSEQGSAYKFKSPSLFKGQVDGHKSNLHKKKIARKMNNNKKKTL